MSKKEASIGMKITGMMELHQKLILTPKVRRYISEEELQHRVVAPPKKVKKQE